MRFGRYRVIRRLGSGGMADVHLAEDPELDRRVAVKVIRPAPHSHPSRQEAFRHEAAALARVRHANIVDIFDFGEEDGEPYLVMEYVEGYGLDWVKRLAPKGRVEATACACLLVQAAEGLRAAHEAGVVHRDIKPENLLLSARGELKVADFGVAVLQSEERVESRLEVVGSPLFMCPEQAGGTETGPEGDLFSLGAVFYHLFTGDYPFQAENLHSLFWKITAEPPRAFAAGDEEEGGFLLLLERMMRKDPQKRGSARETARLARDFLGRKGIYDPLEKAAALYRSIAAPKPGMVLGANAVLTGPG